jgi:twitching motility protein PilT
MNITELLALAVKHNASDLHISTGLPPMLRLDGDLIRLEQPAVTATDAQALILATMTDAQQTSFQAKLDIDYAIDIAGLSRFRVNVFWQQRGLAAVFRLVHTKIPSMAVLGLPLRLREKIATLRHGLVLVTGPTGSGKSTTLAAIIDEINQQRANHILTIEDPIEYIHTPQQCLIHQREVSRHTQSFSRALRSSLREDPDVILIGELRDPETIALAITAAETGHLVFGTLHTSSASKTIHRIIDAFPAGEKEMIRSMLSESLQAVISQVLVKKVGGGRVAALEIMLCNAAIRNLIREDKLAQMQHVMQTHTAEGMQTLASHVKSLYEAGVIAQDIATQMFS